jgi:hypothetical protein
MVTRKILSLTYQNRWGGGGRTLILPFLKPPITSRNPTLSPGRSIKRGLWNAECGREVDRTKNSGLEAALEFREIAGDLGNGKPSHAS